MTAKISDTRPYCLECNARMKCVKNGYRLQHAWGWAQYGDVFECEKCRTRIVSGWGDTHEEGAR